MGNPFHSYRDYVAHKHEGIILGEQITKVHERWTHLGISRQHQHLRMIVLHMIGDVLQTMHSHESSLVLLRLRGRSPIGIWFAVHHNQVKGKDDGERYNSRDVVDEEHDGHAHGKPEQTQPRVVVLEGGTPAERLHKCSVEGAEVDERIGGQVKGGDEGSDEIQLTDEQEARGDKEGKHIAAIGFAMFAIGLGEEDQARIDLIDAQSLHQTRHGQKIRQRCAQCGRKAAGIDERTPQRHGLHHFIGVEETPCAVAGQFAGQLGGDNGAINEITGKAGGIASCSTTSEEHEQGVGCHGDEQRPEGALGNGTACVLEIATNVGSRLDARYTGKEDGEHAEEIVIDTLGITIVRSEVLLKG